MKSVCIGIHIYEQPERLSWTLESLRVNTATTFETVLLADGADAQTRSALASLNDLPQLTNREPRGAAACFNRLATYSDADVIVFLESGAMPGPRWLEHLLRGLYADSRNGLAGPSTNNCWNEQGAFPGGSEQDVTRAAQEAEAKFGDCVRPLEPLHSLADFCYAVRREVIEAIGATDENYSLGPCWEMDYNIRAARAGWLVRLVFPRAAFVDSL